jgi:8-amino-7-oxononanoate synthase
VGETGAPGAFDWLAERALQRERDGLRRTPVARSADDRLLDLASNDYLGLARDPRVVEGAVAAAHTWGAGSTGSRLVTGTTDLHVELERALAELAGAPAALVLASGYAANLAAVVALSGPGALVVSDADNHASLVDACRLSRAQVVVTAHRDVDAVAAALAARTVPRALVVTDGVFSVDGERAPVRELLEVCVAAGAGLLVDEAHAVGVLGPGGAGICADEGAGGHPSLVRTLTLSKSFGAQGGAVVAGRDVVDHLADGARPFMFDTALAPPAAGAALAAVRVLREEPELPDRVRALARALHERVRDAGFESRAPQAAVVPALVGAPEAAVAAARAAALAGVRVGCFRPPSVPDGVSRLRLVARATLSEGDLDRAAVALGAAAQASGVASTAVRT